MTDGDHAAVEIDAFRVDAERGRRCEADSGERLVNLDEVEFGRRDAIAAAGLKDGIGGLVLRARVRAGDHAGGAELGEPLKALSLRVFAAHQHQGARAVGDRGRVACGDRAVGTEGGAQPREYLERGLAARTLVPVDTFLPPRGNGTSTGTISSSNRPSAMAAAAGWCERTANASWSARDEGVMSLTVSVSRPIAWSVNAS